MRSECYVIIMKCPMSDANNYDLQNVQCQVAKSQDHQGSQSE